MCPHKLVPVVNTGCAGAPASVLVNVGERSGMDMWVGLLKQKLHVGFWYGNVTRCFETPCR